MRITLLLGMFLVSCTMAQSQTTQPAKKTRPIVGATRWDAWIGGKHKVGAAVEKTLSPREYHWRLPFFAKIVDDNKAIIDGTTQDIMDTEIIFASNAGLDYWAFVMYDETDPMTTGGIDLYLSSKIKSKINFCVLVQGVDTFTDNFSKRCVRYMKQPTYQTVLDGRPLVYIGFVRVDRNNPVEVKKQKDRLDSFRAMAAEAGLKKPYIVFMEPKASRAKSDADLFGGQALSAYARGNNPPGRPYKELVQWTERHWKEEKETGYPVVPIVMAGWDVRPRVQNPVFWMDQKCTINDYFQTPTPQELAEHLQNAFDWIKANPSATEPMAINIYAWNENDEGGWIVPTLFEGKARLDAIAKVIKNPKNTF